MTNRGNLLLKDQNTGYVHTVPDSKTERRRKCTDRASVHTRNTAFEAVSAPEQYCSASLLKVERSVSDRFLNGPSQV